MKSRLLASIAFVSIVVAAILSTMPLGHNVPLHPFDGFARDGEYASNHDAVAGDRYASWNGDDKKRGMLVSDDFRVAPFVRVTLDGYPSLPGESIYLERAGTRERLAIVPSIDPAETWTTAFVAVPARWLGSMVRLKAIDASSAHRGWIGVADLSNATAAEFAASRLPRSYDLNFRFNAWSAAMAVFFLILIACAANVRIPRVAFALAIASEIAACRLPVTTWPVPFNEDEAQLTAQAFTYASHPIPWLDVDGTTSGPLDSIAVAFPVLVGQSPNLVLSRIAAMAMIFVMLWMLYRAFRSLGSEVAARTSILLPLAFLCGTMDADSLQYASEFFPSMLVAIAIRCIVGFWKTAQLGWLVGAGVAIGALPFAKLQATVFSVALLAIALACTYVCGAEDRRKHILVLGASFLALPLLILGTVAISGAFSDFLYPYVLFPKTYIAGNANSDGGLSFFFAEAPTALYLTGSIATIAAVGLCAIRRCEIAIALVTLRGPSICAGLLVCVAIYSIEAPKSPYQHYILLLVVPLASLVGIVSSPLIHANRIAIVAIALISAGPLAIGMLSHTYFSNRNVFAAPDAREPDISEIRKRVAPGERVAMWGWMPQYLIDTRAMMGTRDSISQFQIEDRPFRPYYRERYLSDLIRNEPRYLLETIGPEQFAFSDRARYGVEAFKELRVLLDERYRLAFETKNVRLFVRK